MAGRPTNQTANKPAARSVIDTREFRYDIDGADTIRQVNEAWIQFAEENGAPDLPKRVCGTRLWDYVDGREVRHVLEALLDRVRQGNLPGPLHFRCDAPDKWRRLELRLALLPKDGVEFVTRILAEGRQRPVDLLRPDAPRDATPAIHMCAWCKRVRLADWVELEQAVETLGLFEQDTFPAITHGVCEACRRRLLG